MVKMTEENTATENNEDTTGVKTEEEPKLETPAENDEEAKVQEEEERQFLHNLCILPPLQKNEDVSNKDNIAKDAVLLPSISPAEPVSAIRGALAEIRGYAHITNYRLVVENIDEELHKSIVEQSKIKTQNERSKDTKSTVSDEHRNGNGNGNSGSKKKKKKGSNGSSSAALSNDVISTYTTSNAAIKVSSSLLSLDTDPTQEECKEGQEVVLNDFGDLSSYVEDNVLDSKMGFRMVLERYDLGLVKEHVIKTRFLLDGNAPCVLRVVGDEEESPKQSDSEDPENEAEGAKQNEPKLDLSEMKLPDIGLKKPVKLDGKNLKDFIYLSCGEEERLKILNGEEMSQFISLQNEKDKDAKDQANEKDPVVEAQNVALRWSQLDDLCHINCSITFGGFNPPPANRHLLGDLAYLEIELPDEGKKFHVTAFPSGFYVNRSTDSNFDPAPANDPCFSHELLDCLLQHSSSLRQAWSNALNASIERSDLAIANDSPVEALFRAVVKRDTNTKSNAYLNAQQQIDLVTLRPSWLVHSSQHEQDTNKLHRRNIERAEEEINSTFGLEVGTGVARDWNEELQSAREMPTSSMVEKIERARVVHKTLLDFAEAAVAGANAIFKGQIAPMNPNEQSRSHVYLHNNIFFSRAIDAGVDTFKVSQGDLCARKSASRDAQSVGTFHKLDISGLHTLATVLIDYLGTRLVCQSIVPGILQGEKTHSILYGAVDATSPLSFDEDLHETLEKKLGKSLMIASRNIQKSPLTKERLEYIEEKKTPPIGIVYRKDEEKTDEEEKDGVTPFFGPIEMKGIRGSDTRTYCLDITRLTPRDANWVPKSSGGTGNFESEQSSKKSLIPATLDDDEWIMAVLRPELITQVTQKKVLERIASQKKNKDTSKESAGNEEEATKESSTKDNSEYMKSLRMNLNVFLPHMKGTEELDSQDVEQLKKDEDFVREAADYLWKTLLPHITSEIRSGSSSSIPVDGRDLTEYLHQRGVNCRYLGQLAKLALQQEVEGKAVEKIVAASGQSGKKLIRFKMPECWLELLECEMVARAAKHVLDGYLTESGCISASQPGSQIASFLSALMTTGEESAAETEIRVGQENNNTTQSPVLPGFDDEIVRRGHREIWNDIEKEIGRRFRYTLNLYNSSDKTHAKRAQYIPLLRRFCQKTGIRLKAKNYTVGGRGLVSSSVSYPISVSDIVEVVPLVKHAASSGDDGFIACAGGAAAASTSLHILLPEAKHAFDAAKVQLNEKRLQTALELAQEATSLYQRVVETPFHNRVFRCLELTSVILYQAQEFDLALVNANKALAVAIQIGGFDCKEVLSSRSNLSHILLNMGSIASAVKQQRAALYLMELIAGPRYVELSNSYHKLGTLYHEIGSVINALRFYQEAFERNNPDRVVEGMLSKHSASILATLGQYKPAYETERRTYDMFRSALGDDHELTKNSEVTMKEYATKSVQQQKILAEEKKKLEEEEKKRQEEKAAAEIGNKIVADEEAAEEKKKKKKKKSSKKKK